MKMRSVRTSVRPQRDVLQPALESGRRLLSSPLGLGVRRAGRPRQMNGGLIENHVEDSQNRVPTRQETPWQTLHNTTDQSQIIGSRLRAPGKQAPVCRLAALQELQRTQIHQTAR